MDDRSATTLARRLTPRLIFGLAVMIVGALLTLDNLGLLEARTFLRFWPLAPIAVGLVKLSRPHEAGDRSAGFFWLGLGGLFLLSSLGVLQIRRLWPLVLLFVGASMVRRALTGVGEEKTRVATAVVEWSTSDAAAPAAKMTGDAFMSCFALMGGVTRGTNSQDFRGGDVTAVMGGCEIDLRRARIGGEEAVIDTFALWGGIEIYVPEDWEVVNRGFALMGGFEDSTKRPAEPKGRLIVTGFALMGGVEVKN